VFVDSKTSDNTLSVAKKLATIIVKVQNTGNVVESIIESISRACSTKWILRLDDDELPSVEMLNFVRQAIAHDQFDVCSFPRHECAISTDGKLVRHKRFDPIAHHQWRLYQKDRVPYIKTCHSPGFLVDGLRATMAPLSASMIHLDWAVHNFETRQTKFERYELDTPGYGSRVPGLILYEQEPNYQSYFESVELSEFTHTVRKLRRRFPHLCVNTSGAEIRGTADSSAFRFTPLKAKIRLATARQPSP
jgi:glycosyltransferase involved in cell wall biosynthesis